VHSQKRDTAHKDIDEISGGLSTKTEPHGSIYAPAGASKGEA